MKFLEQSLDQQNQFGKYVITFVIGFFIGQLVGSIPLFILIISKVLAGEVVTPEIAMNLTALGVSKNMALILILLPTVFSLFFSILLIKYLHNRTFAETVNGRKKWRLDRFWKGAAAWGILMAIYLAGDYFANPGNYVLQFHWLTFIPLFFISILLIPLQTTSEELLFRGYLAQGIAGWKKNRWLAVLIPGLLFGLMHIANPEVKEFGFWLTMPQYVFFGLLFGLIAVLDDGIELSMGMHAANNIFLSLFLTHDASILQTDAVFEQKYLDPAKDFITSIIIGLACFVFFYIKYKWDFGVMNKKVEKDPKEETVELNIVTI